MLHFVDKGPLDFEYLEFVKANPVFFTVWYESFLPKKNIARQFPFLLLVIKFHANFMTEK